MCIQVLEHTLNGTQSTTFSDVDVLTEGEANIQPSAWKAQCEFLHAGTGFCKGIRLMCHASHCNSNRANPTHDW
jgi:hypothetical protein